MDYFKEKDDMISNQIQCGSIFTEGSADAADRFKERLTLIGERRRNTLRQVIMPPTKLGVSDGYVDPELEEIMSLASIAIDREACQLNPLIAMVMACIIEDATESCCIMSKTLGLPDITVDLSFRNMHDRNDLLRSHNTLFNPETLEDYSKNQNVDLMKKLQADIVFLQSMLGKGVYDLLADKNYYSWINCIDNYDLQLEQNEKLLWMVHQKTETLQKLKNQLTSDKIQFIKDNEELSLDIGKARDELEDFIIHSDIKQKYVENWENSRQQQNLRVKKRKENMYEESISLAEKNIKKEKRVHREIEDYMGLYFQDTESAIEEWIITYEKDMERKDEEITKMGLNLETITNDFTELQETFEKRTKEMEDWLERKAIKEKQEEELRFINKMVTKIQAWWRGTMVRKKLGPYRPKKKGGKNKKKKK